MVVLCEFGTSEPSIRIKNVHWVLQNTGLIRKCLEKRLCKIADPYVKTTTAVARTGGQRSWWKHLSNTEPGFCRNARETAMNADWVTIRSRPIAMVCVQPVRCVWACLGVRGAT